jgi:hypothetical protein
LAIFGIIMLFYSPSMVTIFDSFGKQRDVTDAKDKANLIMTKVKNEIHRGNISVTIGDPTPGDVPTGARYVCMGQYENTDAKYFLGGSSSDGSVEALSSITKADKMTIMFSKNTSNTSSVDIYVNVDGYELNDTAKAINPNLTVAGSDTANGVCVISN